VDEIYCISKYIHSNCRYGYHFPPAFTSLTYMPSPHPLSPSLSLHLPQVLARFHAKCFYLRFNTHVVDVCVVPASKPASTSCSNDDDEADADLTSMHAGSGSSSNNSSRIGNSTEPTLAESNLDAIKTSSSLASWVLPDNVQVPSIRRGVVSCSLFTCGHNFNARCNILILCKYMQ